MKRLIILPLLLFACATVAAPPDGPAGNGTTPAGADSAPAGRDAARASDEAARTGDEAAREAAEEQKLADLQKHMNDLAQRMAELSVKIGDQANASALRYLADNKRGMLGIALEDDPAGLRVAAVTPGGPAERAGIRDGDVITAINGTATGTGGDRALAGAMVAGKPVALTVLRDGKTLQVHVTPERFQAADWQALARTAQAAAQQSLAKLNSPEFRKQLDRNIEQAMKQSEKAREEIAAQWAKGFALQGRWFAPWWGLNLSPLNPQLGRYFGTDSGALVLSVDSRNYPGLESGDVITAVDGHAVASPADVMRVLGSSRGNERALLAVRRHGKPLTVDFKVPSRSALMPPPPPDLNPNPDWNPDPNPDPGLNPDPNPLPPTASTSSSTHPPQQ